MDLDEYRELKQEVDSLRSKADKSQGSLDQLMSRLKRDFGVSSIEEAEEFIAKLQRELDRAESTIGPKLREWRKRWRENAPE